MRYRPVFVLLVVTGTVNLVQVRAAEEGSPPPAAGSSKQVSAPGGAVLETAAQEWLGRAESGDLIPAWNVKEPPPGIPPAYDVAPAVVKEARTRCRFHSEKERRALLLCLQIFGEYTREDIPRVGLRLPTPFIPFIPPPRLPPDAVIDVR